MTTYSIPVPELGTIPVTVTEAGPADGPVTLLLHGGAGPQSVLGFGARLAEERGARVLTPVHPGFGGTPRPEALHTIGGLARLYASLLDELDVSEVTVIGNSIGAWIAAELAALGSARIARVALVGAVGLVVPGFTPVDFFSLPLSEVADYSYHEPDKFRIDPSTFTPEQQAIGAANRDALATYGGVAMVDATLGGRLGEIKVPVLVIAGESDRISPPDLGRAFAAAIPGARFQLLTETGHLPQLETPDALSAALAAFDEETEVDNA